MLEAMQPRMLTETSAGNYQGWFVVEAEQDPDKANPLEYAKKARTFIREHTGI